MHNIKVKTLGAVLAAFATLNTHAAENVETGEGTLFRSLLGDTLEKDYGITVFGLFDVGYSRNNRSTHDKRQDGLSNLPLVGFADEGLEWGGLHLFALGPLSNVAAHQREKRLVSLLARLREACSLFRTAGASQRPFHPGVQLSGTRAPHPLFRSRG
jgi:hypothetical protein